MIVATNKAPAKDNGARMFMFATPFATRLQIFPKYVRLWHLADMRWCTANVRLGQSVHANRVTESARRLHAQSKRAGLP